MTEPSPDAHARVDALCAQLAASLPAGAAAPVQRIRDALHGPLSLAVAGARRSGVSTLLNAIAGERLAPTGVTTPTRTWYRPGTELRASALVGDERRPLPVRRPAGGPVEVDLTADLPGLRGLEIETSLRTDDIAFVDAGGFDPTEGDRSAARRALSSPRARWRAADVVVHLAPAVAAHPIEAFGSLLDQSLGAPSPRDAIAVVARADEIGDGGRDAFATATRLAHELRGQRPFLFACATVLPVSGLLAEAAMTLETGAVDDLRLLLAEPDTKLAEALVSVNRFCHPGLLRMPVERRHALVSRLGLAGIGVALRTLHAQPGASLDDVAGQLRATSGIDGLRAEIDQRFVARRHEILAASALARLQTVLARLLRGPHDAAARSAAAEATAIERADPDQAERRVLRLVAAGAVRLSEAEVREVGAVLTGATVVERAGQPPGTPPDALRGQIEAARRRWHILGSSPVIDEGLAEVCAAMTRRFELDVRQLAGPG
jgi:hypothetical protein